MSTATQRWARILATVLIPLPLLAPDGIERKRTRVRAAAGSPASGSGPGGGVAAQLTAANFAAAPANRRAAGGLASQEDVLVLPDSGQLLISSTTANVATFTVHNVGSATSTYDLSCDASAHVSNCAPSVTSITLAPGEVANVEVSYAGTEDEEGSLELLADGEGWDNSDSGSYSVIDLGLDEVVVTPDGGVLHTESGTSGQITFTYYVDDAGSHQFECATTGPISCSIPEDSAFIVDGFHTHQVDYSIDPGATGTARLEFTVAGDETDTGYVDFSIASQVVLAHALVTPKADTITVPLGSREVIFIVTNDGGAAEEFEMSCSVVGPLGSCSRSPSSLTLDPGDSVAVTVDFSVSSAGEGTVTLDASLEDDFGDPASADTGRYVVRAVDASIAVTPDAGQATANVNTVDNLVLFTLHNDGPSEDSYALSCSVFGRVTACTPAQPSITIPGFETRAVEVTYATAADPAGGYVKLLATGLGNSDEGLYSVAVRGAIVAVTPDTAVMEVPRASSGNSAVFTLENSGVIADTYSLSCYRSSPVTSCTPLVDPVMVPAGGQVTVEVSYATSASVDTGHIQLNATGSANHDSGRYDVVTLGAIVAVDPSGQNLHVPSNYAQNHVSFEVSNQGNASDTYALTCTPGGSLVPSCTISATSVQLDPGDTATVEVTFPTANIAGSGTVMLEAAGSYSTDVRTGTYHLQSGLAEVVVEPDTGTVSTLSNTAGNRVAFTVRNASELYEEYYTLSCAVAGNATACTPSVSSILLPPDGSPQTVEVIYDIGTAGPAAVSLTATAPDNTDTGTYTVSAVGDVVTVTPDTGTVAIVDEFHGDESVHLVNFIVSNNSTLRHTYTLECRMGPPVDSCTLPGSSLTLSPGRLANVEVAFTVSDDPGGWIELVASAPGAGNSDAGRYTVVDGDDAPITVTPDAGAIVAAPNATAVALFELMADHSGDATLTCTFTGAVTGCSAPAEEGVSFSGAEQVEVMYTTGGSGTGAIGLTAVHEDGSEDSGTYHVTLQPQLVAVTPDSATATVDRGPPGLVQFTVRNLSVLTEDVSLVCTGPFSTSTCTPNPSALTLAPGDSATVEASFTTDADGDGTVQLTATSGSGTDKGQYLVTVLGEDVRVTPDNEPLTVAANTSGLRLTYTIRNVGNASGSYDLSCNWSGTAVSFCESTDHHVTLAPDESVQVDVIYNTASAGTSSLRLRATGPTTDNIGSYSITIGGSAIAVGPDGASTAAPTNTTGNTLTFTVQNLGTLPDTVQLTCSPTGWAGSVGECTVLPPTTLELDAGDSDPATVTYSTAGVGTGTVSLVAVGRENADSAWYTINVQNLVQKRPIITLEGVYSDSLIERSACVTSGAGPAGAFQCGDLLVTHSMPPFRTMNRQRTLTLLYNSATAEPRPLVPLNIQLDSVTAPPDEIRVHLKVEGTTHIATYTAAGLSPGGDARRIVMWFDASGLATGLYPAVLTVSSVYGGQVCPTCESVDTTQVIVVNRSNSSYGAGWSVAGVEQLFIPTGTAANSILLVKADGSAAVYGQIGADMWLAPRGAYRDTIYRGTVSENGISGTYYWRYLKDRTRILYNLAGKQKWVIGRAGNKVEYSYKDDQNPAAPLAQIRIAPYGQLWVYSFWYTNQFCNDASCRLDFIQDPTRSGTRRLEAELDAAGNLDFLVSPGNAPGEEVDFGYFGHLLIRRSSPRGAGTTYTYEDGFLRRATLPWTPAGTGVIEYLAAQVHGLNAQAAGGAPDQTASLDSMFVSIDGPRENVQDTARLYVNEFGAPTTIVNALADSTTIAYGDARFPLLATGVEYPNGRKVEMVYDSAANLRFAKDLTHSSGQVAVTEYQYDAEWNAVTAIIPPEPGTITFGYDPNNGNRLWTSNATGDTTYFRWYDSGSWLGLLKAIDEPDVTAADSAAPADSFVYNQDGNLIETHDARGHVWTYGYDESGNPNYSKDPTGLETAIQFTAGSLDSVTVRSKPGVTQTVMIEKRHDADGNTTGLWDPIRHFYRWDHDALGRVIEKADPEAREETFEYDPAGNLKAHHTRRGHTITYTYDALNRVKTKTLPPADESSTFQPTFSIPGEAVHFDYDEVGNLILAADRDSRVERQYNKEGTLKLETQMIGAVANPSDLSLHVYTWEYEYDLNNRVETVYHPAEFPLDGNRGRTTYGYDTRGNVDKLVNVFDHEFIFQFDARTRLDSIFMPNGTKVGYGYYPDNSLRTNRQTSPDTGDFPNGVIVDDVLTRDEVGNVTLRVPRNGNQVVYDYDAFHRLKKFDDSIQRQGARELITYDAAGNRVTFDRPIMDQAEYRNYVYQPDGRLHAVQEPIGGVWVDRMRFTWYDDGSRKTRHGKVDAVKVQIGTTTTKLIPRALEVFAKYFYDAAGQLVGIESQKELTDATIDTKLMEFRYDALGRRILKQEYFNAALYQTYRFVYNGSGRLYVVDADADAPFTESDVFWITYTANPHSESMLHRNYLNEDEHWYYHRNEQGSVLKVTDETGGLKFSGVGYMSFGAPDQPLLDGGRDDYTGRTTDEDWAGTGLVYLRNRYYDPSTGRFLQEDPIGFAGGINLYAYARNNPATYTDPFGLAPCPPECGAIHAFGAALGGAVGAILGAAGGAVAGTIVLPIAGTLGGGAAGIVAGAAEGAAIGVASANLAQAGADLLIGTATELGKIKWRELIGQLGLVLGLEVFQKIKPPPPPPQGEENVGPPPPKPKLPDELKPKD